MSSLTSRDTLRMIVVEMERMKEIIGHVGSSALRPLSLPTAAPPKLQLQFPSDIILSIDSFDLPERKIQQLKTLVTQKVQELQRAVVHSYEQTCRDIPRTQYTECILKSIFQQAYENRHLLAIRSEVSNIASRLQSSRSKKDHQRQKAPFNFEYVPYLEKYFEQNAYPSSQDRRVLARKSMMSPRQIEVWFQNHRNRAKKEGKTLKRLNPYCSLKFSAADGPRELTSMPSESTNLLSNSLHVDSSDCDEESGDGDVKSDVCILSNDHRPPHAFPTRYPPNDIRDPFPSDNGIFKFPSTEWRRLATTTPISAHSSIDMDSLVTMFSFKLTLREGSKPMKKTPRANNIEPWFSWMIVVPCPAPHPAFLRSSYIQPAFATSVSRHTEFRYRKPISAPLPLRFPSWIIPSDNASKVRRTTNLPKRMPSSTRLCMAASTIGSTSSSRVSSFSSVSSLDSISTSSESSPEPTTPPQSSRNIAQDIGDFSATGNMDFFDDIFSEHEHSSFDFLSSEMVDTILSSKSDSMSHNWLSLFPTEP